MTEYDDVRRAVAAIDEEAPPVLEVAERLAAATDRSVDAAQRTVYDALDAEVLVEEGEGWGGVRLAEAYRDGADGDTTKPPNTDERKAEEPETRDKTPTPDADKSASKTAVDALDAALEYFHTQLDKTITDHDEDGSHTDRPTTAREYFRGRGWDDDTIDDMRLGWAPASSVGLLDHLMRAGYDREQILGTGLFADDLTPLWRGRYVLPYFDGEGRPVYAIARCTGSKGGGAAGYDGHPEDLLAGKYAKLRHTDDRVPFDEPIYGHHTLREGEPVVVGEGIADAITAAEAGYAVLSPVAKEFKREHYDPLLEAVDEFDVPRVTVIPDSERAGFDRVEDAADPDSIREAVSVPATSPGMGGALRTADHLADRLGDEPTTVRVAELPLPATTEEYHKVDLDDFVHTWESDLEAVLASAKPAQAYREYDAATASVSSEPSEDSRDPSEDSREAAEYVGRETSGLWDLDLGDLENLRDGERTKNPFRHTGDSENYFVVRQQSGGDLIATDYKGSGGGVTYNALTALLVDAGERSRDDPEGPLSDVEVFYAWRQARQRRDLAENDPVPYRGLRGIAVEDGLVDRDDLVARDSDTGEVVDADDHNRDTYDALPPGTYADVLEHVREEYGLDPGRDVADRGDDTDEVGREETARELFDDPVVVEPRDAWRAAGAVRPDDLDPAEDGRIVSLDVTDDGDAWAIAEGRRVDGVVRAVALEEGLAHDADADLGADTFDEAYRRARRHYGAPLPEYVDETTATDQKWILYGALDQIDHYHLDGIRSTVTDTGEGDVVAEINPSWEYSASGHRVLAFRSGWFYCREHDTSLDALRFVALEEGILAGCHDDLEDEAFLEAVDALRDRGAPVPRYDGEVIDHEAVLPEADDLLEEFTTDADRLDAARLDVEAVVEEAAADATQADLVTALPALGKTTSTVKNAARQPTLYAAPRKELQAEVLEKAEAYGVSAYTLPVLAENHIRRDAKAEGAAAVREHGQDLLRRRDELVERIESDIHPDPDAEDVAEDDEVELDRATCPTANGAHGDAWQVAVQVAAQLRYPPEAIHKRSRALFGEQIPCTCDEDDADEASGECAYSQAWERVADPDRPVDLLVGSRTHAYVRSARTWYGRDGDRVDVEPRAVAVDEFPDDAYGSRYGEEAPAIATWLGTALREDLADQRDVLEAGLWDTWVRDWAHGTSSGDALPAFDHIDRRLEACRLLLDAREEIGELPAADRPPAAEALRAAVERGVGRDADAADLSALADAALGTVRDDDALPQHIVGDLGALLGDLRDALGEVDGPIGEADLTVEGDRLGETLRDVVDTALEGALVDGADHALEAGRDVCRGGDAGTQALAVHADDPYAHPDAYLLLAGMVGEGEVVRTSQFRFDPTRPQTHLTRTRLDGATVLFDRDHDGAYVLDPPEFVDTAGRDCPVLGLDATGRETLWSLALGEDVRRRDIHDSARERREFLRDVLNLQVVQTSPHVNSYSYVQNQNFDGDVELVRTVAEEYGAGRLRADTLSTTTKPGVITTKKARGRIESRLEDDVGAIDHYGNVTGSNDLDAHNIGVVLGSRHFSDAPVEKWAAIAGEEVSRTGRGADLSYGSDVAEEYLTHMREDQTMQAILRFGRDEEGALVFAHTSALAEDLPVVGDGAVVSAHSSGGVEVRDALLPYLKRGRSFAVSDLVEDVDVGRRTVQRKLREFADLGYLEREEHGAGRASTFAPRDDPGHGDVELPAVAGPGERDRDSEPFTQYHTGIVGVRDGDLTARGPPGGTRAQLPAPSAADATVDGVEPPG